MRTRRVIAFVGLVFTAWTIGASGAEPSVHDTQGPSRWHVGSTWIVLLFATDHRLVGSITVRVTREKAVSCMDGDWKRLEILRRQFKGSGPLPTRPLSYSLRGNKLTFGATDVCDAYILLSGTVTKKSLSGDYGTLGLGGFHKFGYFRATMVKD